MRGDLRFLRVMVNFSGLLFICSTIAGCLLPGSTDDHSILRHHHKKKDSNPTIIISGLVMFPGIREIPDGGLSLRDAIGIAGGDQPFERFNVLENEEILVSLDRKNVVYSFQLQLVMNGLAGEILLLAGDKISVNRYSESDLAKMVRFKLNKQKLEVSSINEITYKEKEWSAIFGDKFGQEKNLIVEYDVPFRVFNEQRSLRIQIQPKKEPNVSLSFSIEGLPGLSPTNLMKNEETESAKNSSVLSVGENLLTPKKPNTRIPTLYAFSNSVAYKSQTATSKSVIILNRKFSGKVHSYILPRDVSAMSLIATFVIPGDSVSIDELNRLPIILTSLAAPQLFDPARHEKNTNHARLHDVVDHIKDTVNPISNRIQGVTKNITRPLH